MTENEFALINIIRSHPNPEQAFVIAVDIICKHLKQFESPELSSPACPPALSEANQ